jgi:hypothetical protein
MSITSAQSYEMRIARKGDEISDPPQPYWQTVERLLADRGESIMSSAFSPTRYVYFALAAVLSNSKVSVINSFTLRHQDVSFTKFFYAIRTRVRR